MKYLFKNINNYIFYYGEFIAIAILFYFWNVINPIFFFVYLAFLIAIIFTKHLWLKKIEVPTKKFSLLPMAIFLMEFFVIFIAYTGIYEDTPIYKRTDIIVAVAGIISLLLSTAFTNSKIFSEIFVVGVVAGLLFSALLDKISFMHGLNGVFVEVCKAIFSIIVILVVKKFPEKNIIKISLGMAFLAFMYLFVLNEYGTFTVIIASYFIYLISEGRKKTIFFAILGIMMIYTVWAIIYKNDNIYAAIRKAVESINVDDDSILSKVLPNLFKEPDKLKSYKETVLTALSRLFFDYSEDSQLVMLNDISLGRKFIFEVLKLTSPSKYVKIVSFETSNTTAEADYLFSVMTYSIGKIYTCIITFSILAYYCISINKNIDNPSRIIPIILISQTIIHITGNIMLFPFTGIPYPFLSHGATSLLCNILMIFILTKYEADEV